MSSLFQVAEDMQGTRDDPIVQLAVLTNEVKHTREDIGDLRVDVEKWRKECLSYQCRTGWTHRAIEGIQFVWSLVVLVLGLRNP